jgi:hypothetical protein
MRLGRCPLPFPCSPHLGKDAAIYAGRCCSLTWATAAASLRACDGHTFLTPLLREL